MILCRGTESLLNKMYDHYETRAYSGRLLAYCIRADGFRLLTASPSLIERNLALSTFAGSRTFQLQLMSMTSSVRQVRWMSLDVPEVKASRLAFLAKVSLRLTWRWCASSFAAKFSRCLAIQLFVPWTLVQWLDSSFGL